MNLLLIFEQAGIFAIAAFVCYALYRPPVLELQKSLTTSQKLRRVSYYYR
jgi:hypothetical protein